MAGILLVGGFVLVNLIGWWGGRPARLRALARSDLNQARAALAADRAAEADRTLAEAIRLDPAGQAEAWRLRLEILRVEDRGPEALGLGREALAVLPQAEARGVLQAVTAAVFAEIPDDQARDRLGRWTCADPGDTDARVALLNRMATMPRPGDPARPERIRELEAIVARDPGNAFARAALGNALADAGEVDAVRAVLEAWPVAGRDARHDLLRGQWDLDHDGQPERALGSFRRAVAALPHVWRAHYGLARALRALGREDEARAEATTVAKLRERLDPATLGPRLAAALRAPGDDPRVAADLAALCDQTGLADLADAWRRESVRP